MAFKEKNKTSHYRTDTTVDNKVSEVEKLEPCVKYVVECWEQWDAHLSTKMSDFERYYDRWKGKPPVREEEWQSQFHKKLTWQAEKALIAQFHPALFPIPAPIEVDATEVQDEFSGILAKSVVAHWFKIGKFTLEFLRAMRSAGVYGTGLLEDDWYVRKEIVYEKIEEQIDDFRPIVSVVGKRPVTKENKKTSVVEDRYRVRKANIFSWRIHPSKLSDDDDYPAIKQEFITFDTLVERQSELERYGGKGFEKGVLDKIKKDKFKVNEADINRMQKDGDFDDKKSPNIEVLSYWGLYGEEDDEKLPYWIMVVNRKYKLRISENPFWHKKPPLFHINWHEDEKDSYYGIGVAEVGASAEDRVNTTINIRTDERKKNVRGGGWYNANDKKINKKLLQRNLPGLLKPCSDVNTSVRPDLAIPKSTQDDYKEEETTVSDHREITGATSSLLPTGDDKTPHKTLGGMKLLLGQSTQRLKPDLVNMEMMGIRVAANRAFLLTRQFMTEPMMIELVASSDQLKQFGVKKIYELTPDKIINKVNFYCTGLSETIETSQKIDSLLKYAEMTSKIPPMMQITNYQGIAKRIALWLGFEDLGDLIMFNPAAPLAPQPPAPAPVLPGPQGVPGLPPGIPQGMPQGLLPTGLPPGLPPPNVMPQVPGNGGLPPEIINLIASRMQMQGRQP